MDEGEASAIALSTEKVDALLILDDLQARKLAEKLGLRYTGTLGMIARARSEGVIESVKPIIEKIRNTNFRFSEEVFTAINKNSGRRMSEKPVPNKLQRPALTNSTNKFIAPSTIFAT